MSISRLSAHCQSDSIAARQAVPKHCPLHNRVEFPILYPYPSDFPVSAERYIMIFQPGYQGSYFLVCPRPGGPSPEILKHLSNILMTGIYYKSIDTVKIKPISLHGNNTKSFFRYKSFADSGAPGVIFVRTVRGFTEQHIMCLTDSINKRFKVLRMIQRVSLFLVLVGSEQPKIRKFFLLHFFLFSDYILKKVKTVVMKK
jgi:hypothetical protein